MSLGLVGSELCIRHWGEGLRSIVRPQPLTPTLSHKGRGSSLPLPLLIML
jgi:hypothetical protein